MTTLLLAGRVSTGYESPSHPSSRRAVGAFFHVHLNEHAINEPTQTRTLHRSGRVPTSPRTHGGVISQGLGWYPARTMERPGLGRFVYCMFIQMDMKKSPYG